MGPTASSASRPTTDDEGDGQLSSFEPDITATVLHRQVARHVLGSDPAQIDALVDRVIDANMKFPWSYVCRALAGVDTAIWDLYGKLKGKPVCELVGGKTDPVSGLWVQHATRYFARRRSRATGQAAGRTRIQSVQGAAGRAHGPRSRCLAGTHGSV